MYFIFAHGSPWEGEAGGGLGDLKSFHTDLADVLEAVRKLNREYPHFDVEVLNGKNGEIIEIPSKEQKDG